MKLRSNHIAAAIVLAVSAFVITMVMYERPGIDPVEASDLTPAGSLPPVDGDRDQTPMIVLHDSTLDLGIVRNDDVTMAELTVLNDGRAPLRISDVRTTCACTEGVLPRDGLVIPPGRDAVLPVRFNPFRVALFDSKQTLTLFSNDPDNPFITVEVVAKIDPEFAIEPEAIDFGQVNKGDLPEATVHLRQIGDEPLEIKEITTFGQQVDRVQDSGGVHFSHEMAPESEWAEADKPEYRVNVALTPDIPAGDFQRNLYINTTLRRIPSIRVHLTGEVLADYSIEPSYPQRVMLRPSGDGVARGVATVRGEGAIEISDIRVDETRLAVAVAPGETDSELRIEITVQPDAPAGRLEEEVRFTLHAGDAVYTDRIGVRGFVTQ